MKLRMRVFYITCLIVGCVLLMTNAENLEMNFPAFLFIILCLKLSGIGLIALFYHKYYLRFYSKNISD